MKREHILTYALQCAALAAVVVAALPDPSWAQSLVNSVNSVKQGVVQMPVVASGLAYTMGGIFLLTGALSLKKHAENPGQNAIYPGLMKMGLGGALASIPALVGWVQSTLATNGSQGNINGQVLNAISQ